MTTNDARAQLIRARELISQRQFDEARALLTPLAAHNDTARRWLAKLDEIAPAAPAPPPAADPFTSPPTSSTDTPGPISNTQGAAMPQGQVAVNFTLDVRMVRYGVGALVAFMGVLMIVGFFFFPWLDLGDINFMGFSADMFGEPEDKGPLEITALELWMGRNGDENFTLDLEKEADPAGFADVRLLDRFLLLIPFGGLVLVWLAWVYALPAGADMSPRASALTMVVVALVMFLFPLLWQELSTNEIEDDFKAQMEIEGDGDFGDFEMFFDFSGFAQIYTDTYSTGEQQLLGALALLTGLIGLGAEFLLKPETSTITI
ncbi:MAG: hypothetical protein K8S97_15035 [Anaerolineae bacterium]|nr:hypothetical protein [Anaerolineae bacterium]